MNRPISVCAAALAALTLWAPCAAQSPLCTINPFQGGNGLSGNAIVFFDLNVTTPVLVNSIDTNSYSTASTPITVQIYTTPGTWVGNNSNPAAWTMVAQDAGGVLAAGRENVTAVPLAAPWVLGTGSIGVAIVTDGGHSYTNGNGTNQNFSTNEMSIALGAATTYPTGAPFTSTGLNNPRVWNGCLHYVPQSGLYPSFTASPTVGTSPLQVQFTDTSFSSDPGGITAWAWDFDNDGTVDSTAQNPSHTYTVGGTYSVSLSVTDATHGTQTRLEADYIVVDPIDADFTATPAAGAAPLTVQFADTSTGNPIAWNWDFDNDGTVDSTAQNPQFVYTNGGTYSVSLSVTNGANIDTETKVDLIRVLGATNNTASAELLEYQFNEPRGATTANTAATTAAPEHGTLPADGWQGDPGRPLWQGNDPGYGCLAADDTSPYESVVDTGWVVDVSGSNTIMFWTRCPTGSAGTSYGMGLTGGGSGRIYFTGGSMSLRSWGPVQITAAGSDPASLPGWNHWAIVIDDQAGTAQWYLNGVADGSSTSFTPGTFAFNPGGTLLVGRYSSTSTVMTRYFDMDDFRVYARALTPAELSQAAMSENPTTGTFGSGCAGAAGVPLLGASGGAPTVTGNASFALEAVNMEAGRPAAVNLGLRQTANPALPIDLGFIGPQFTGCFVEVAPDLVTLSVANASGSATVPLAIPADPALANFHIYAQLVVLGSSQGAVSPALDVNLK